MASPDPLILSLLRPPILHILRATGFTTTRPSVLDTLVDLTSRYLILLAQKTSHHYHQRSPHGSLVHDTSDLTITDTRLAMQDLGALFPQISELEEQVRGEEDMRGIDAFIAWCTGETNKEIRRIAELTPEVDALAKPVDLTDPKTAAATAEASALEAPKEDFLSQLKKKHAKTKDGEEARYQGTALGKDLGEREVRIEGWELDSIQAWGEMLREKNQPKGVAEIREDMQARGESDSSLSEISVDTR